jgi:thiamine-monophosphate kinase
MGEFELLARVRERLPPPGSRVRVGMGDDAAVTVPGGATATSVDALVEGVHFRRGQANLAQIGHKALAVALSDLAAMGAEPGEAYVVLGVPADLDEDGCIELLDGLLALAATTGTTLAGGDVTRSAELVLTMTVVGHAPAPERLVTRSGARPGDALVLTGEIGGAGAGLALLEHPELEGALPAGTVERARARQLEPRPRLGAGRALAAAGATAMIDVSDGLGGDAAHLAEESGVGLRIDGRAVPLIDDARAVLPDPISLAAVATGEDGWRFAFSSGEDYELLASLPAERLEEATRAVADAEEIALTKIGEVVAAGGGVEIRLPDGRLLEPEGFDQLD